MYLNRMLLYHNNKYLKRKNGKADFLLCRYEDQTLLILFSPVG